VEPSSRFEYISTWGIVSAFLYIFMWGNGMWRPDPSFYSFYFFNYNFLKFIL